MRADKMVMWTKGLRGCNGKVVYREMGNCFLLGQVGK